MADFQISESSRYGAAVTIGPAASYSHHKGRYLILLSGAGFEASNFASEDDLRDLRDWINEALGDPPLGDMLAGLREAVTDFISDSNNDLGPDISRLREAIAAIEAQEEQ